MKQASKRIIAGGLTLGAGLRSQSALAISELKKGIADVNPGGPTDLMGSDGIFKKAVNVLLFLIGAVSVIMIIYGGIRYVTSGGNQNQVTAAKNTILYAVVGLVIAILAYAAVNFIVSSFTTP